MFIAWVTEDWVMYQCNHFSGTLYFMDIGNSNTFLKTPTAVHLCKKRTLKKIHSTTFSRKSLFCHHKTECDIQRSLVL